LSRYYLFNDKLIEIISIQKTGSLFYTDYATYLPYIRDSGIFNFNIEKFCKLEGKELTVKQVDYYIMGKL
jgi:hypothetical protein